MLSWPFASTVGSRLLSSFHFSPRAAIVLSAVNQSPRFCFNPRTIASESESGRSPGTTWPVRTLPVNPPSVMDLGIVTVTAPPLLELPGVTCPPLNDGNRREITEPQRRQKTMRGRVMARIYFLGTL